MFQNFVEAMDNSTTEKFEHHYYKFVQIIDCLMHVLTMEWYFFVTYFDLHSADSPNPFQLLNSTQSVRQIFESFEYSELSKLD